MTTTITARPEGPGQARDKASLNATRLPSLTGMRIIAAGMVFFFHAAYENAFRSHTAGNVFFWIFGQGGWTGVGFFFVLSGFVLTWSARPTDTVRAFWRRRVCKIYPNHLVTYLAGLGLLVWAASPIGLGRALLNLFLLQAWSPSLATETSVNPVAWSLSCEALFYLCFPLLLRWITKIDERRLWWYAGGIVAVVLVMPLISMTLPQGPHVFFGPITQWQFWLVYVAPPVRLLDFGLGIILARIVRSGRWFNLGLLPSFGLLILGYLAPHVLPYSFCLVATTIIPVSFVICAGATADVRGTRSFLRTGTMVWLGDVSFAVYLWHREVLSNLHRLVGSARSWNTPEAVGMLLIAAAVTLLLSWALHDLVEIPVMKRWSKPRKKPAGAATPLEPVPLPATGAAGS
ncbi:MAG TPA: acyltransferase [Actinocrinis sp.]|nr:acyltransferase [Actinocrinis sp.]